MPVDAATPHDIQELASPVSQRVFFAGEHTSSSHPAQVSGALLSGLRAAGEVHFTLGALSESFARGGGEGKWDGGRGSQGRDEVESSHESTSGPSHAVQV